MSKRKLSSGATNLTEGSPAKLLLRFMIPMLIGNMCQQLYNTVDTIIVGRFVGTTALAAVGSTGTIFFLIIGTANGMATGFTVLTSQTYGAGDRRGTGASLANSILLSLLVAAVLTITSLSLLPSLLRAMNTPRDMYQYAYDYISVICMGVVCTLYYNLFSSALRAVGNSRMPLFFLLFSSCLNIILDLALIICFGMGTRGAALATILSQGISAVLCVAYIYRSVPELRPDPDQWHFHGQYTGLQMRVALPMAVQYGITASGTLVEQSAVNLFGSVAAAGFTAAVKIHMLLSQGHFSMGQTIAAFAGQNYGIRDTGRIRKGCSIAFRMMLVYSITTGILVNVLLPYLLPLFFTGDVAIREILPWSRTFVRINTLFYQPLAMIFIYRSAMQGCNYSMRAMTLGIVELAARTVLALASMRLGSYELAVAADGAAWLAAGVYGILLYYVTMGQLERKLALSARSG